MREQEISTRIEIIETFNSALESINDLYDFIDDVKEWFAIGVPNELLPSNDSNTDRRKNRKKKEEI